MPLLLAMIGVSVLASTHTGRDSFHFLYSYSWQLEPDSSWMLPIIFLTFFPSL
jgi:hypothetical protein